MNRDADIELLRRTPLLPGRTCQVAVPPAAHARSTLPHLNREDAFIVNVGPDQERTGEQWPIDLVSHSDHHPNRPGLEGEVLSKRQQHTLLATFLQLQHPMAATVWVGVASGHDTSWDTSSSRPAAG